MTSNDSTTGRDIVLALVILSGVSVGGPLFFPDTVSVEESGLLLGAVFATLIVVAIVARLFGAAIGIGRVLLLAVLIGTALWGLQLYAGHQKQAEVAVAFTDAVTRFDAERQELRSRFTNEAASLPSPPVSDPVAMSDRANLPESRRQIQAYRAWAESSRATHLDALDAGIEAVRDAAGTPSNPDALPALRVFEEEALRVRDYWKRYWDAELQATGVTLEMLDLLDSASATADARAGGFAFTDESDRIRFHELSSRLEGIRAGQAADLQEFERFGE
jgi:hypothetical protein